MCTDLDEFHSLTWQPEIHEYLPGWNVTKEQRKNWLINYEILENKQFLIAVSQGGVIGELRLRMGIELRESGELIGWCCTGIDAWTTNRLNDSGVPLKQKAIIWRSMTHTMIF